MGVTLLHALEPNVVNNDTDLMEEEDILLSTYYHPGTTQNGFTCITVTFRRAM